MPLELDYGHLICMYIYNMLYYIYQYVRLCEASHESNLPANTPARFIDATSATSPSILLFVIYCHCCYCLGLSQYL